MSRGADGFDGLDRADFAVGSVTGLRVWKLRRDDGKLEGQWGGVWADGENIARCKPTGMRDGCGDVPGADCGCGFYGYWELRGTPVFSPSDSAVLGVIEGYGTTEIGDRGFRAARARIVALCLEFDVMDTTAEGRWTSMLGPRELHPDAEYIKTLVECDLEDAYPSARIWSTRAAMLAAHPPTRDYLPAPAEPEPPPALRATFAAQPGDTWYAITQRGVMTPLTPRQKDLLARWPGKVINLP